PSVTGLKGTAFGGDIVLEWDSIPDRDLAYFLVEKKDRLGKYQEVKKVYNILGLNISDLEPGVDYRFRVTAFDKMGNQGEPAEIIVNSGSDSTPPIVTYEYSSHKIYSGNNSININPFIAKDNVGVKKLILEYSVDMINWINICERVIDKPARQVRFNENWDVSSLAEGDYFVRALAEDEAGNMSLPSEAAIYTVDHTKPAAPFDLTFTATAGYIEVMWKYLAEKDFSFFKLWRSESEDGTYENITPGYYVYMGYRDRTVETGKTYYYKVTVVDVADNESEPSETIIGSLTEDKIAPTIYFRNPLEGDILNSKALFSISFSDDLALKSMKVEYRKEGSGDGDDSWEVIITRDYNPDGLSKKSYANEEFYWENKGLPEGRYKVRVTVEDSAGNITGPLVMTYLVNNVAPPKPTITAEAGGWQASLNWISDNNIEDFHMYKLYRTTVLGGSARNILSTGEKSFNDIGIQPGIRYYYYVRAYDIYGNYSQSDTVSVIPTAEDKILPVADAGDEHILVVGMEGFFDGTLSSDNHRIASYHWDFGDGGTAVTSRPTHSYNAVGDYTATLTVTDPAGNTAVDTTGVKVVSIDEVGILEVKVIDDVTGELLPGSSVVIDYPDGATHKTTTNSVGAAFVIAPPGDYEVYAFKTDFRPASAKVTMVRGQKNTVMIRLPKGSVVTGELKAERMDIDEIIAAGIDITDPANQNAYKFEIGLGFNMPDIPIIATKHKFIRPANAPQNYTVSEDGSKIIIRERIDEEGKGSGRIFFGEKIDASFDVPAMAYMVIPGKTTWLKEFFDIGLTIQNAAGPEFVIEDAWARLTIPDGLSLAPTREGQHEYVEMGSIPGGESKSVNWIIRGDKKGEYRLKAEFNGLLMPFEDEIKQIFRNDEPFRVWAEDAVLMHIITQDRADKGYPYNLKLGIENISEISLYNLSLELLEETKANYIYAPNQELIKSVAELKPGETLWGEYQLISAIEGLLSLKQSYNLKTGGNTDIEEEMSAISVPENSPDNAPVLNQENKDDGTVNLSWEQVEGALGYKIYRIREDLRISMDPEELVYSCRLEGLPGELSEDISVNLPEPDGPKDYVINTLIADGEDVKEVTLHAITGFSWIENAAEPTITVEPETLIVGRETELLVTAKEGGKPVHIIANPAERPSYRINGTIDIGDLAKNQRLNDNGQVRVVVKPEKPGPIEIKSYLLGRFITRKTINAVLPEEPKQPQGLKASKGDRKAKLTWFPNSEPEVKGYYIYRVIDNIWTKIHPGIYKCDRSEGLVSYEVTGLNDNTTYTFQVSAVDAFNRESVPSKPAQVTLTIPEDTIAPWVVGSNPVSRQKDVPVDTKIIQIFFSENIALWETYENIEVKAGDVTVEFIAEAEIGTNILTITLNEELPLKTHCQVFIPEGAVRDKSFNELKSENKGDYAYKLEFFTEAENDTICPMLIAASPKENAQSVTVHSTIFLYFSEKIDEGPAYDNIMITANGIAVPHSKEINGAKIIIKPLSEPTYKGVLPYNSKIEIFVPEGAVVDSAGNVLKNQHGLKFYTDTVPDLNAPKIIRMKPSANSRDLPLDTELNIYFSERIKEG
ncbi:MAG TPA: Ig-like domain-containing protein, partial [Clostridiales bacterium]|nr:Ig-like domain-containing protein [Clostridiales bacterium]